MAKLYGPDGQPIEVRRLKEEQAGPTVTGVRQVTSGHPAQGLTPVRLARLLRGAEEGDATAYLELAEEMEEKDLHYLGVLGTRKRAVAQLGISVEAASDDKADIAAADLVRDFLARDTLGDELFDILDAIGKGFSAVEILWETSERQWMPRALEWRDPRWFEFDRDDGRTLRLRGEGGQPEGLAPFKFILHMPKAKSGLPIRGGLARPVAWYWLFKNLDIKSWVVFLEAFGQPMRVGKYDRGASEAQKQVLLRAVRNVAADAAAIIPDGMVIEFVEAKLAGNLELFERMADWLDRQVSKGVLGQTLTTEVKGGSYAAASVHNDVREDIERSDAQQLAATLNRDLVRPLVDLNRGPQKRYPRLRIGRPDQLTEGQVAALKDLVPLGLRVGMSTVRDRLGFPDPDQDEEVLGPVPTPVPAGEAVQVSTHAARPRAAAARDRIDDMADELDAAAAPAMDALINRVRGLLDECKTLTEVGERLLALYPDLDAGGVAEAMAEALAMADLQGRAEVAGD